MYSGEGGQQNNKMSFFCSCGLFVEAEPKHRVMPFPPQAGAAKPVTMETQRACACELLLMDCLSLSFSELMRVTKLALLPLSLSPSPSPRSFFGLVGGRGSGDSLVYRFLSLWKAVMSSVTDRNPLLFSETVCVCVF